MAVLERPIDKEFNTEAELGERFSTTFLNNLIDTHSSKIAPRLRHWQRLYEGKHSILKKRERKQYKKANKRDPNNVVVNDFFGQIIDNTVGYFLGNPVILNYTEPKTDKPDIEPNDVGVDLEELEDTAVQDWLDYTHSDNDMADTIIEWGKESCIKGLSHLLVYQNEEGKTKVMRVSPDDMILVYKNSSTKELQNAIRLYDIDTEDTNRTTHYAEVYSMGANGRARMELFKSTDDNNVAMGKDRSREFAGYEFVEETPLIYERIPVVTLYNNEERMSDLEKIETLVNDYDKVLSDMSDEFSVFRNAYLVLRNMIVDEKGKTQLKEEAIIELMENGDAFFLTKQIQTDALENHLKRLEDNIYKFSQVPNLSDENFAGNLSGVAIRFKLFGLETKCIIKERKMEKALKDYMRILSVPIRVATGHEVDVTNLKIEFTRNVPNNLIEIVDTVAKLDGKVDKETLLSLLPFVDNPKEILEKMEAEEREQKKNNDIYSDRNMEADAEALFPNRVITGGSNLPLNDNTLTDGGVE